MLRENSDCHKFKNRHMNFIRRFFDSVILKYSALTGIALEYAFSALKPEG